MATIKVYPEEFLTYSNTDIEFTLGDTFDLDGCTYMYVQISASSANAASAGRVFYETGVTGVVSDDYTAALSKKTAGVALGTIAKSSYGFILKKGLKTAVLKAAVATTAGLYALPSSTDGAAGCQASAGAALSSLPMGVWTATYSAGAASGTMFVDC